jgi:GntR family transcriptional repressor for pyruvate dehydrogenase complex
MRSRRVAEGIQEMIRREAIPPGGSLPSELDLARRFRVSRPVVREALQALRALGVVASRPRTGLRVLPLDPDRHFDQLIPRIRTREERAELYEFRCLLEPALLDLVARRATPADLDRLSRRLESPLPRGRAGVREGIARDAAFHEELWRLSGNRFVGSLRGLLVRYFADLEARDGPRISAGTMRLTNRQHLEVVRALRRGDVARARRALSRNLRMFRPTPGRAS